MPIKQGTARPVAVGNDPERVMVDAVGVFVPVGAPVETVVSLVVVPMAEEVVTLEDEVAVETVVDVVTEAELHVPGLPTGQVVPAGQPMGITSTSQRFSHSHLKRVVPTGVGAEH